MRARRLVLSSITLGVSAVILAAIFGFQDPKPLNEQSILEKRTVSIKRASQYSLGILIYMSDYDENFPYVESNKSLQRVVRPYIKNDEVFNTLNPAKPGIFLYNMSLGGLDSSQIEDPAKTPLLYDPTPWPNERYIVSYTDGHVKAETADNWKERQPLLKIKLKRKGKPIKP